MTQALPIVGYEFVEVSLEILLATEDDSENGYFVDVDLEYSDPLKKVFFPLCPESEKV